MSELPVASREAALRIALAARALNQLDVKAFVGALIEKFDAPLTEAKLGSYMALAYAPDPDLFIRTGGEVRVSNFLLWQLAYAEFYFTACLWPDFDAAELDKALASYAGRERRFGAVTPTAA